MAHHGNMSLSFSVTQALGPTCHSFSVTQAVPDAALSCRHAHTMQGPKHVLHVSACERQFRRAMRCCAVSCLYAPTLTSPPHVPSRSLLRALQGHFQPLISYRIVLFRPPLALGSSQPDGPVGPSKSEKSATGINKMPVACAGHGVDAVQLQGPHKARLPPSSHLRQRLPYCAAHLETVARACRAQQHLQRQTL
jgi:hypothetical protein